jgi:hypothetical protein
MFLGEGVPSFWHATTRERPSPPASGSLLALGHGLHRPHHLGDVERGARGLIASAGRRSASACSEGSPALSPGAPSFPQSIRRIAAITASASGISRAGLRW